MSESSHCKYAASICDKNQTCRKYAVGLVDYGYEIYFVVFSGRRRVNNVLHIITHFLALRRPTSGRAACYLGEPQEIKSNPEELVVS